MPPSSRRPSNRRPRGQGRPRGPGATDSSGNQGLVDVAPSIRRSLRFTGTVTSTASSIVTRAGLLSMLVASPGYGAGVTTLVLVPVYEAIRVRRVTVTMPQTSISTTEPSQSLTFEWFSFLGRNLRLTKTVTSSQGGSFSTVPPRGSRAAMWSSANTAPNALTSLEEVLFVISHTPDLGAPAVTVPVLLTIEFDAVMSDDTNSVVTLTATNTNGTAAGIFCLPIDLFNQSNAIGSARLSPVGYPDARLDTTNASIALSAASRTN